MFQSRSAGLFSCNLSNSRILISRLSVGHWGSTPRMVESMGPEDASSDAPLQRRVNQLDHSGRLPVELLCAIFRIAGQRGFDIRTNLNIATVCSFWRDVAHADPWMWTCLELNQPGLGFLPQEVAESLVERSRPCPLEIHQRTVDNPPTWAWELVSSNIDRLTLLQDLDCPDWDARPILAAPRLENLRLFYCGLPRAAAFLVRIPAIDVNHTPRLTTVEMDGFRLAWDSPLYRNRTNLSISAWEGRSDHPPDDADILEIAHGSPNLQHLQILFHDTSQPDPPPSQDLPSSTPLYMHALHTLELTLRDEHALRLLCGIVLPDHVQSVRLCIYSRSSETLDTLLGYRYLPSCLFANLHDLKLSSHNTDGYVNQWVITVDGEGCTPQGATSQLELEIEYLGNCVLPRHCNIHRVLPSHTDLPRLKKLLLSESQPKSVLESAGALARLLVRTPTLVTLGLQGKGFSSQFEVLRRALEATTKPPFNSALPHLERINIGGDMESSRSYDNSWDDANTFVDVIPLLRLFKAHLREIHMDAITSFHLGDESDDAILVRIFESFRGLGVPEIWWNPSFLRDNRVVYARDLWPKGELYTWRCLNEEEHDLSSELRCEFCGAPRSLASSESINF